MRLPFLTEIPYRPDSAALFEAIADLPWAVFLDGGHHHPGQSRHDILSAQPYIRLTTRGNLTQVDTDRIELMREDPFALLRRFLDPDPACAGTLPFHGNDPACPGSLPFHGNDPACPGSLPFHGGAIGYFAYDLARRVERLPARALDLERMPDMAVGIYDWALVVDHLDRRSWLVAEGRDPETDIKWDRLVALFSEPAVERARAPFRVASPVTSNLTRERYGRAFDRIKRYIAEGDCYQVNLAQRFSAQATGDPWLAYQALRVLSPAPFGAYLSTPYAHVLSASPERFLKVDRGRVEAKPIKGTRPRAGHPRHDAELAEALRVSEKDRAENVMIVDLLRNDLSKNCRLGSVRVPRLFDVESFATVHHLVSTVTGELSAGRDAIDLLRGSFPGGSITGAPKLRAMQIIEELEPHRRGVYCGAIGYVGYDGNMDLNIAIRTMVFSRGELRFSVGGGIVADSRVDDEYQETLDKAAAMLKLVQQSGVRAVNSER